MAVWKARRDSSKVRLNETLRPNSQHLYTSLSWRFLAWSAREIVTPDRKKVTYAALTLRSGIRENSAEWSGSVAAGAWHQSDLAILGLEFATHCLL
jgi:hypothetical protein